jgi:hypothetical protein
MTSSDLRCPSCGAQARPEADWCTLCYKALRPSVEQPTAAQPAPSLSRGRHAKGASDESPTTSYDAAGAGRDAADTGEAKVLPNVDAMLAQLAAESRTSLTSMPGRLGTGPTKIAIITGGVVAVGIVAFIVMTVVGALL